MDLGQLIYDLRTEAGLSQRELADRMGTTQSVISRLEEGGSAKNLIDTLGRVATALDRHLVLSFPTEVPHKLTNAIQVAWGLVVARRSSARAWPRLACASLLSLRSMDNQRSAADTAGRRFPRWGNENDSTGDQWMSPGEIHDIFKGTEQIQQLVISRAISGLRIE